MVWIAKTWVRVFLPNGKSQAQNIAVFGTEKPLIDLVELPPGARAEFDRRSSPTPDLFFGFVEGFKHMPIIRTLRRLCHSVSSAIEKVAEA